MADVNDSENRTHLAQCREKSTGLEMRRPGFQSYLCRLLVVSLSFFIYEIDEIHDLYWLLVCLTGSSEIMHENML